MSRSLGIVLALFAGVTIGFLLGRVRIPSSPSSAGPARAVAESRQTAAGPKGKELSDRIVLGNITTVPFQELYSLLGRHSPPEIAAIAAQLRDLPEGRAKNERVRTFFKAWAQLDASAAFDAALKFQSTETRSAAIGATVEGADAASAPGLAESIKRLGEDAISADQKSSLLGAAVTKWAKVDAAAAADFLDRTQAKGMGFAMAFHEVTNSWAATDPAAAMDCAIAHANTINGAQALTGAISGWWEKDPAAAQAYARAHADDPNGQQLTSAIVSQLARQDRNKAAAWVDTLPTLEDRHMGYGMIAIQSAITDPTAAAVWAASLPNDTQSPALDAAISVWANTDPAAAAQWMQTLSGSIRDEAAATYSIIVAGKNPAAAAAWAVSIEEPKKRASAVKGVIAQWMTRDRNAARAWVQNSSLGEEEKAQLLASPAPSP